MLSRLVGLRLPLAQTPRLVCARSLFSDAPASANDEDKQVASVEGGNKLERHIFDEPLIYDAPPGETGHLSVVGPDVYKGRTAVIDQGLWESVHYYKRSHWRISFDRLTPWTNQLMGWSSNADPLSALHEKLKFETKEDAIKFCIAQGIEFSVEEPANPHEEIGDMDYADNFLSKYVKSQMSKGLGEQQFTYDNQDRRSAWVNLDCNKFGSASWDQKEKKWREWKGGEADRNYSAVAGCPHPRDAGTATE